MSRIIYKCFSPTINQIIPSKYRSGNSINSSLSSMIPFHFFCFLFCFRVLFFVFFFLLPLFSRNPRRLRQKQIPSLFEAAARAIMKTVHRERGGEKESGARGSRRCRPRNTLPRRDAKNFFCFNSLTQHCCFLPAYIRRENLLLQQ